MKKLTASDFEGSGQRGGSIGFSGDTVVVGAPLVSGDMSGDAVVDAVDALFSLQLVSGLPVDLPAGCGTAAVSALATTQGGTDVCGDDADAVDALKILQLVAELPTNLPAGCPAIGT